MGTTSVFIQSNILIWSLSYFSISCYLFLIPRFLFWQWATPYFFCPLAPPQVQAVRHKYTSQAQLIILDSRLPILHPSESFSSPTTHKLVKWASVRSIWLPKTLCLMGRGYPASYILHEPRIKRVTNWTRIYGRRVCLQWDDKRQFANLLWWNSRRVEGNFSLWNSRRTCYLGAPSHCVRLGRKVSLWKFTCFSLYPSGTSRSFLE